METAFALAIKAVLDAPLVAGEGKYEFYTRQRLVETCKVAYEHWKIEKARKQISVIAVEQPFNVQMPDGRFISGRADQIINWSGAIWGRDFKTTSKIEQYFTATLDPNDQATRYIYMESALHFGADFMEKRKFIKGIIFEVIQNTKTTVPKIYNAIITKNHYQLETWEQEQIFLHSQLKNNIEQDFWPMHEGNCTFCDYSKVCKAPSSASQENILRNEYHLSPWDHEKVEQVVISEG